jgi:ADP-heptose:LPS heptosyltransferase
MLDDPASWDLRLTEQECSKADHVLQPTGARRFIAVSLGTKNQSKDWGQGNWHALLTRIATLYPTYALVLCGAAVEKEDSELATTGWRNVSASPVVNLCGVVSPRESAAVLKRAALFIGHDSGPMHLAASVQTPCVAIFSSRNLPRVWYPYGRNHQVIYHNVDCQGCGLETCIVQEKKCILSITVNEVLHAITAYLT